MNSMKNSSQLTAWKPPVHEQHENVKSMDGMETSSPSTEWKPPVKQQLKEKFTSVNSLKTSSP
jgi:hypothetical protein